ncbi:MAG TPA: 50S ribosomal protein L10 [Gemmatimonadales bacterium]|nr:50S ribosomal protein L10 [Gemmatimonadales bacterium]
MSKTERQSSVEALTERLKGSATLYITDFTGLTVDRMTDFRRRLRAVGARYVVVKNTLARRALAAGNITAIEGELLKGPVGIVLAGDDPLPAAKVLGEFAKQHEKPSVKAGLVEGRKVEAAYVKRLGELPSREVLLGTFVGALNGILYQVVGALEALREKRQAEGPTQSSN